VSEKWVGYNELAWLEPVIAPPEKYTEETERYSALIKKHALIEPRTILHLGSGAGMNDYILKKHFKVTGVDLSEGMLAEARKINPEVEYHPGDMRFIKLNEKFDVVFSPESIGYMTSENDLHKVLQNAYAHLNPGGVFIFTTFLRESFRENNFIYTGAKDDLEVTVFENNYLVKPDNKVYEAILVYLVRQGGELEIYTDRHILGLFEKNEWFKLLQETGFAVFFEEHDDYYTSYIVDEGKYILHTFICTRPLNSG